MKASSHLINCTAISAQATHQVTQRFYEIRRIGGRRSIWGKRGGQRVRSQECRIGQTQVAGGPTAGWVSHRPGRVALLIARENNVKVYRLHSVCTLLL